MITSKLLQAAAKALEQLDGEFSSEERDEALAFIGVGPRAVSRLIDKMATEMRVPEPDLLSRAFLIGVLSERLGLAIGFDFIDYEATMKILGDGSDEPYPEAPQEDIQDVLQMAYGIATEDGASLDTLAEILINALDEHDELPDTDTPEES